MVSDPSADSPRFTVDLDACENHGQCALNAPDLFSLDDDAMLSFRAEAEHTYTSRQLTSAEVAEAERAASMCPMMAISVN